ncbi:MAG TPA: hypothetical protein VFB14_04405 [Bryobacteraceae bacterium]|nr:hypothetical protein [Bryobacteraceae bacterium]
MAKIGRTDTASTGSSQPPSTPIPKFLAYRHFLAWAESLNNKAMAARETDPYKFGEPFQRAGLGHEDLDALLKEAKSLDSDLQGYRQKLQVIVTKYREAAAAALRNGSALPAAPPEI